MVGCIVFWLVWCCPSGHQRRALWIHPPPTRCQATTHAILNKLYPLIVCLRAPFTLGLEALAKLHRRSLGAPSPAAKQAQSAGGPARGRAEADAFCTAAGLMQGPTLPANRCLPRQSSCQGQRFKAAGGAVEGRMLGRLPARGQAAV